MTMMPRLLSTKLDGSPYKKEGHPSLTVLNPVRKGREQTAEINMELVCTEAANPMHSNSVRWEIGRRVRGFGVLEHGPRR